MAPTNAPTSSPVDVPPGFWQREASHCPRPLSPLMRSLLPMINDGFRRMFREMGVLPETLEWREIGGWVYTRVVPPGGKDRKAPPGWLMPVVVRLVPAFRRSTRQAAEAAAHRSASAGTWSAGTPNGGPTWWPASPTCGAQTSRPSTGPASSTIPGRSWT